MTIQIRAVGTFVLLCFGVLEEEKAGCPISWKIRKVASSTSGDANFEEEHRSSRPFHLKPHGTIPW